MRSDEEPGQGQDNQWWYVKRDYIKGIPPDWIMVRRGDEGPPSEADESDEVWVPQEVYASIDPRGGRPCFDWRREQRFRTCGIFVANYF